MARSPRVSIVTTTYNYPEVLKLTMETALDQTFADFEYLVIGDGCTDETEDVVAAFDDPRIRWRNLPENLGNQSDVNRIALDMAQGDYIAYLNHDDLWFSDHLALLMDCIDRGGFDIASSLCLSFGPPPLVHRRVMGYPTLSDDGNGDGLTIASVTSTVLHEKSLAQKAGGWAKWREFDGIPTRDFFSRIRAVSGNHAVVPRVTCLKFNSATRFNSYQIKDGSEQQFWRQQMLSDPDLRHRELAAALALQRVRVTAPHLNTPAKPANARPGWQIEQFRRARGLKPMVDLGDTPAVQGLNTTPLDETSPVRLGAEGQIWITPPITTTDSTDD